MPPARFELTAPGLGILCSIHLSYGGTSVFNNLHGPARLSTTKCLQNVSTHGRGMGRNDPALGIGSRDVSRTGRKNKKGIQERELRCGVYEPVSRKHRHLQKEYSLYGRTANS
jgi:hypothetical protein